MKPQGILIANATCARLLQQESGAPFVILKSFTHSQGRSTIGEPVDDRAGNETTANTFSDTSCQPRKDARHTENEHFARELANDLERQAQSGRFDSLAIFASSPFLGELKAELGPATIRMLSGMHDVDLTSFAPAELAKRIGREVAT